MKYTLLLLVLTLSVLIVGCDSGGSDDSSQLFNSNSNAVTGTGLTPGAVPNLPNAGTATMTVESVDQTIIGGVTHAFTVTISGVSGFGSFIPATVAAAATGTVSGLPVTINFGPLTQVGTNTFEALGVFTSPLAGPGTIVVPINYVEGASAAPPLNQIFTVLSSGPPPENCSNGADDDGDGLIDCADPDCPLGVPPCDNIEICTNGVDDDGDGLIDCADSDCASSPACAEDCTNGIDDDGDGLIDCADPDCGASPACSCSASDATPATADDCATTTAVACSGANTFTTTGAGTDGAPTCITSNTAPGVWFTYDVPTGLSSVTFTTCDGTFPGSGTYDTKISVFTGSCASLVCVGGNDDSCTGGSSGLLSTVVVDGSSSTPLSGVEGSTIFVLVHGFSSGSGSGVLWVEETP